MSMSIERREEYVSMEAKISEIHRRIDDHLETEREDAAQLAGMKKDIESLQRTVEEMADTVEQILALLEQSKGVLRFIKLLAVLTTTGAAAWAWIAGHITFTAAGK